MTQAPIGIFDSGVGGLTLTHTIMQHLPNEQVIYVGDTAHLPYGDKSAQTIAHYAARICDFLLTQGCKLIVIACNSASAACYNTLKDKLTGQALVIDVINPVARYLKQHFAHQPMALIGTKQTVNSGRYQDVLNTLNADIKLTCLATPLLAPIVEEGLQQSEIAKAALAYYLQSPSAKTALATARALILGCTHYALLQDSIEHLMGHECEVINPNALVVTEVAKSLHHHKLLSETKKSPDAFFVSDLSDNFNQMAKGFFGDDVALQHCPLWD